MQSDRVRHASARCDCQFRLEGEIWTVAYEGRLVHLKDAKGLRYLAHLLRHPGRRWAVTELAAADDSRRHNGGRGDTERSRKAVTNRLRQTIARIAAIHPALGLHLTNAVHTGTHCAYTPDRPVTWSDL
jgi:hypothetical protein